MSLLSSLLLLIVVARLFGRGFSRVLDRIDAGLTTGAIHVRLPDGTRPIEHIFEGGGPDVWFEIDCGWITRAGADPGGSRHGGGRQGVRRGRAAHRRLGPLAVAGGGARGEPARH